MTQHLASRPRRIVLSALAGASIVALAAGCSGTPAAQESSEPVEGGSLTFALDSSPDNLDPGSSSSAVNAEVMRQVFDSLVWQSPDHEFKPWLAEDWSVSDDGTEYTFSLRDGVTFHDGSEFDAASVCFNFDRVTDPATKSRSAISALGAFYDGCEASGDLEVTLSLTQPDATFLSGLSQVWLGIQSPAAVEEYGDDITTHPVGTGPFVFDSMALNSNVVLTKNADYDWAPEGMNHSGAAYLDTLKFLVVTEPTTRFRSIGNNVDAAEAIATQDVATAKEDPALGVDVVSVPGTPYQLFFNESHAPWDTVEARKAARMAMDIPSIIESLYFGVYDRAWSPLTPASKYFDDSLEGSVEYDIDAAKAAFDDLGWVEGDDGYRYKDGEVLKLDYLVPSAKREKRQQVAQFLQENLKDAGIKVNLEFLASGPYSATRDKNEYDMMGLSLTSGYSALGSIYDSENYPAPGKGNYYNYAQLESEQVDTWIEKAQLAADDAEAETYWTNIQQFVIENAVSVPIYNYNYTVAYAAGVHDISYNWKSYPVFYDAYVSEK
ncbi:ABC transporter substrate-binding protein [Paramicrobacterium agarici]|uniref:ABC transporter substrate-binding protein n=1 Tax=Paramicrobacterium agarici TaxID=630514 RepID=UPI001154F33B|nr:ABC transporter substrate-binding protein [Microbacterium agarici]TQO23306.1 peptide/nickel transport system substrate-binding protein [Microbacterium agarici]